MAANTNTIATLTQENRTFYNKTLLKRLLPNLVYAKYGQKKSIPKKEGGAIHFRRFNSLTPPAAPLTEGVTPDGSSLSITAVTAQPDQYGAYVTISDKLDLVGIDPVLTETAEVLGESAAKLVDDVVRDEVVSGTNVQYAGGKANRDAITGADKISAEEINKAVKVLKKANAKPLQDGYYVGIIDPDVALDIMKDPLWQDISKYNGGGAIMKGEVGKIGKVRFIETTNNKVVENAGSVPVHCTMIIGADAYGVVDLDGKVKPEMIVKSFGSGGTEDPLDQRATSGYKLMFTAKRLQELAMIRVESAATV